MRFGIVGGDKRLAYLAKSIARDGYPVTVCGLERAEGLSEIEMLPLGELVQVCTHIVLPLPATKDGKTLSAPYSENKIILDDAFAAAMECVTVYGGLMKKVVKTSDLWNKIHYADYYEREELVLGNAMLTAEGAVALAIYEFCGSLNHADCLVTGFGRIGKALCMLLKGFGAHVDCAARRDKDMVGIRCMGCDAVAYHGIRKRYDVIFNTVPVMVLGASQLAKQDSDTVIIELASLPGGVDTQAAERLGIPIISAQSIPGRISPKTAGEYIKEAIYNMMEEFS